MKSSNPNTSYRSRSDRLLGHVLRGLALTTGALVVTIAVFLVLESIPALQSLGLSRFLGDASWHPTEGRFGMLPMIAGTALTSAGAVIVAAPLGILSAIFQRYYAPSTLASLYRRILGLLAGIPSVVYGLWGLVVLVPWIGKIQAPGASVLAGVLVLSLMILPTIGLLVDAALVRVNEEWHQGAAALGLSRATLLRHIVLPSIRAEIVTSLILATGRAMGETMAVLMVCGNVVQIPGGAFDPVRTLTANIALEMSYALGDHRASLFVSGFLLLVMSLLLVALSSLGAGRKIL